MNELKFSRTIVNKAVSKESNMKIQQNINCPKCHLTPKINLVKNDPKNVLISCLNCNTSEKESLSNLVNSKSIYTKKYIPKCSVERMHFSDTRNSVIYCRNCDFYFCNSCLANHEKNFKGVHKLSPIDLPIIEKCQEHNNEKKFFCFDCNKEICELCTKIDHIGHYTVNLDMLVNNGYLLKYEKYLNICNFKINQLNVSLKNTCIEKFKNEIINKQKEYEQKMKKISEEYKSVAEKLSYKMNKINEFYIRNSRINNNLLKYCQLLLNMYTVNRPYINFNIVRNILENSNFNISNINVDKSSDEEIINYFQNDYILTKYEAKENILKTLILKYAKNSISSIYQTVETNEEIELLNDVNNSNNNTNKNEKSYYEENKSNITIYLDALNKSLKNKNKIKFQNIGEHNVILCFENESTSSKFMYYKMKNLKQIDLSFFNTIFINNMKGMFDQCSNLVSIDLTFFNTSSVTDMSFMFNQCSSLNYLDLSSFNTSNVKNMSTMFQQCSSLSNLNLSSFNTFSVTDMSFMFNQCSSLTSLNISSFNTSNVKNMTTMFQQCSNLKFINLTNFNTSNVENMSTMFQNCTSLKSLNLNSFNTKDVTDMSFMFNNCSAMNSLKFSSSNFNTSNVKNMNTMFQNCKLLRNINLNNFNTSLVTDMSFMFNNCCSLSCLNLSNFNTSKVKNMSTMFQQCNSLIKINFSSSFNTQNVRDMSYMFSNCGALTNINVSMFDTTHVTNMEFMFAECGSLLSLDLNNFNTLEVKNMSTMFHSCSSLTSLNFSSLFNTNNVRDMSYMFSSCEALNELDLSSFNYVSACNLSFMFDSCSSLTVLNLIPFKGQDNNLDGLFNDCSKLKNIYVDKDNVNLMDYIQKNYDNIKIN